MLHQVFPGAFQTKPQIDIMKLNLIIRTLVACTTVFMAACSSTVSEYVPASAGTATGDIRVDALTSVSTRSRIVPGAPSAKAVITAAPYGSGWVNTAEGIEIETHRERLTKGAQEVLVGIGAASGGVGIATGQMRSVMNVRNSSRSSASASASAVSNPPDKPFGSVVPGSEKYP
jgi:hypothetical protein